MSIRLMSQIWEEVDLPPSAKIVLLKLADHADDAGRNAWPSVGRLAHDCRLDKRSVYRILQRLKGEDPVDGEKPDQATIERNSIIHAEGHAGRSVVYRVDIEKAKSLYPLAPYEPVHRKGFPVAAPESASGDRRTSRLVAAREKGDTLSPFSSDAKGDTQDTKGDTGVAARVTPESYKPPLEPSTEPPDSPSCVPPRENPIAGEEATSDRARLTDLATWQPDERDRRYAEERGLDPDRIAQDIRDWAANAAPSKRRKRDPHAAWRGWCRREADRRTNYPAANGGGRGRRSDAIRDAARRVIARGG